MKSPSLLIKKSLKALTFCFFFTFIQSINAQAQSNDATDVKPLKQYDVEILLFKNKKVPKGNEKILPVQAPFLDEVYISFANQTDIDNALEHGFIKLDEGEFRLNSIAQKVNTSSRYQLLSHMAWRQPGLAKEQALAVHIRTGKQFGNDYSSIDNPVKPLLSSEQLNEENINKTFSISNSTDINEGQPELVWYELEGKITITLARYLHAYVDLVIRIPSDNSIVINDANTVSNHLNTQDETSFTSETLNNFAFKEHRRMRSRRLHYLDHPEVSMLILITPYEELEKIEFIEEDLNLNSKDNN